MIEASARIRRRMINWVQQPERPSDPKHERGTAGDPANALARQSTPNGGEEAS